MTRALKLAEPESLRGTSWLRKRNLDVSKTKEEKTMENVTWRLFAAIVLGLYSLVVLGFHLSHYPSPRREIALMEFARANPGDVEKGRMLFQEYHLCSYCHKTSGKGGGIGPELYGVSKKYDRETLMKKILQPPPGSLMPPGYRNVLTGQQFANLLAYLESLTGGEAGKRNQL
jgi:cytochrome c553